MLTSRFRDILGRTLSLVSAALVLSAAIDLFGGYSIHLGPLRLASHSVTRDLLIAAAIGALAAAVWGRDQIESRAARALVRLERSASPLSCVLALAVLVVGLTFATRCACGSDQYGYVSQADLWVKGSLHVPEPLAVSVPWPFAEWVFSPLGYRPATYPGAIVPTYAPGLPMLMAAAIAISHVRSAAFVVVPALGAVAVWCTFLIGRRLDSGVTGLLGALLLSFSATFLFHLIQPMSDVAATAWWLIAAVLIFRGGRWSTFFAGLATSAAVLTRPNLVPLAIVVGAFAVTNAGDRRSRLGLLTLFAAGALPGPIAVALIQRSLYGSPFHSGYGSLSSLYEFANAGPNLRLYPSWLIESHGPFIFLGLLAPVVWARSRDRLRPQARRIVWFTYALSAVLFGAYLFYSPFDNWTYTRFLLPAFPLVLLLGAWLPFALARRVRSATAQLIAVVVVAFVACSWANRAVERRILLSGRGESRYVAAGEYVAATTPPDALVLAMQHSGSIRYYSGRTTVRYDWLDPHALDDAVRTIQRMNRGPLLVLDDWEESGFRRRFEGQLWGALDWPPRIEFESQPKVRVYDPADRERFRANEPVRTIRIPMAR